MAERESSHRHNNDRQSNCKRYSAIYSKIPRSLEQAPHNTWLHLCVHFLVRPFSSFLCSFGFYRMRTWVWIHFKGQNYSNKTHSLCLYTFFPLLYVIYFCASVIFFRQTNMCASAPQLTVMNISCQNFIDIYSMISYAVSEFWVIKIHFWAQRANKRKKCWRKNRILANIFPIVRRERKKRTSNVKCGNSLTMHGRWANEYIWGKKEQNRTKQKINKDECEWARQPRKSEGKMSVLDFCFSSNVKHHHHHGQSRISNDQQ